MDGVDGVDECWVGDGGVNGVDGVDGCGELIVNPNPPNVFKHQNGVMVTPHLLVWIKIKLQQSNHTI